MHNKFLTLIFIFSSFIAISQPGASVALTDASGTLTLSYFSTDGTGRHTYGDPGSYHLLYSGTQWQVEFNGLGVAFANTNDNTPNPPIWGDGTWTLENPIFEPLTNVQFSAALPVELSRFEGNTKATFNELTWQTTSEINNNGFEIERSKDGVRFEKLVLSKEMAHQEPFKITHLMTKSLLMVFLTTV
jgi:hypothetical protein